jgi:pyruvate/2-oxoglutarate dehydrogenase complex dihydrolipoamide acyltransferase (E2) component
MGGNHMTQVIVPSLGMSGMDVKIESWFKSEGDMVEKGEALFEISSEKLNQEIEAPETGTLTKIYKQEGEMVAVGELLAEIE